MFSNKDLKNLIIPLFLEQLLTILVGLADTFVISFVGEAAVFGVFFPDCKNVFRSSCDSSLFPKRERRTLHEAVDMQMKCRAGGILFLQTFKGYAPVLRGMEYGVFCSDAGYYAVF